MDNDQSSTELPLAGMTIIELAGADASLPLRLAVALAAKIAGDLGAQVVKLEPQAGDPVRRLSPLLDPAREASGSALFEFLNTGKLALRLPAEPCPALKELLTERVDAVIGAGGDFGLTIAQERGIAAVEVADWPAAMPETPKRLTEFTALALGGLLHMIGDPQREPLRLGGHQAAYAAGLAAFSALMALLAARDLGSCPEPARVSLVETVFWVNWKAVAGAHANGYSPGREGAASEFQVWPCQDGYMALVFTATQYDALCRLIGHPELRDPKFATRERRRRHIAAFHALIRPWFASRRREDIYAEAQALQVPLGPTYTPIDLLDDPQYAARDFLAAMQHPDVGSVRLPVLPVQWNGRRFMPHPLQSLPVAGKAGREFLS